MQTIEKLNPNSRTENPSHRNPTTSRSATSLLYWDQATYMPPGGAAARGRQMATSDTLPTRFIARHRAAVGIYGPTGSLPYDSDEASLIRITQQDYEERCTFLPWSLNIVLRSYEAWAKARTANDFAAVQPYLEKTLDLSRELANFFPGYSIC